MCDYCAWIAEVLAKIDAKEKKRPLRVDPVVIVHGGAGRIPGYARKFMLDEVKAVSNIVRSYRTKEKHDEGKKKS